MLMPELIAKKRDGHPLSDQEIAFFVNGVQAQTIADYQISAMLMAIFLRGMDARETATLTLEMANSGDVADLSAIDGVKVDKHSTGGVGDLTTLVALPVAAACGAVVAKMSGRSLGHTGGTLDKLWSIPGCRTDLQMDEFIAQTKAIGCALIGQTGSFAPVDKKLYALRDVTATVESLPLIVSSILSKKIAAGCDAMVLDVKTGSGAFMQTIEESIQLANEMVSIGTRAGKQVVALVTDMEQPLGSCIGNALEVKEAVSILKGERFGRARELSLVVAAHMVSLGLGLGYDEAHARASKALESGAAFQKLKSLVAAQGGDALALEDVSRLPKAACIHDVPAPESGYITALNSRALGVAAGHLGASRMEQSAQIDYGVGIELLVAVGDGVCKGQSIARIHAKTSEAALRCQSELLAATKIGPQAPSPRPLVYKTIRAIKS